MKIARLAAVALAALLVTAGAAAAAPGNAPVFAGDADEQTDDHRPEHAGNASDDRPATENAPASAADGDAPRAAVDERGPPIELPAPVPDHVTAIHDLIRQHVADDLEGILGNAIADVTPDEENDEA